MFLIKLCWTVSLASRLVFPVLACAWAIWADARSTCFIVLMKPAAYGAHLLFATSSSVAPPAIISPIAALAWNSRFCFLTSFPSSCIRMISTPAWNGLIFPRTLPPPSTCCGPLTCRATVLPLGIHSPPRSTSPRRGSPRAYMLGRLLASHSSLLEVRGGDGPDARDSHTMPQHCILLRQRHLSLCHRHIMHPNPGGKALSTCPWHITHDLG